MIDSKSIIVEKCVSRLKELDLYKDERYQNKLLEEIKDIEALMEFDYVYSVYSNEERYAKNENNLLVFYLLGIVDDFDIDKSSEYIQGEFPDIDIDYSEKVRDYLKNVWSPEYFGKEKVCAIGSYTTFGIKSSLIDMTGVYGKDKNKIKAITTKLGLKDNEGKSLTWEKALEEFEELRHYCEENPEVAEASRRILNRIRGTGVHAAGLIISDRPIDNLVPLIKGKDGTPGKDGVPASAFSEGLSSTDLGPLGLIKMDYLIIKLMRIGLCCELIKKRHGISSICALPGQTDWSDTSYLEDPKALAVANRGDLKCIFQFDSDGIRKMVKSGGVDRFNDLVVYSSLYRPSTLRKKMDKTYIDRKRGIEKYEIHPVLEPILGDNYGIMIFQEDIMKILRIVGKIPDMHCEIVRKAISKKKVEVFGKYKEMFIKNGQEVLNWSQEKVEELWRLVEAFSEYGFNRSHGVAYTYISSRMLWLKTYYPLEFFTSVLFCENDVDKYKDYMDEAARFGVKFQKVDLNKSHVNFKIVDDLPYAGFSNIKGIGEDIVVKIIEGQPYSSFEDFLQRFGTSADVIKPLIALRVFPEVDLKKLYYFYEYYKDQYKKIKAQSERYEEAKQRNLEDLKQYVLENTQEYMDYLVKNLIDVEVESDDKEKRASSKIELRKLQYKINEKYGEKICSEIIKIGKKQAKSNRMRLNKVKEILSYDEFDCCIMENSKLIDEAYVKILESVVQVAEKKYYGFCWKHVLTTSEDYMGNQNLASFEAAEDLAIAACEMHIIAKPIKRTSKKGTSYYVVKMEDDNSKVCDITFWEDDYERFKKELEFWSGDDFMGNFVRVRLRKPEPPFNNYTFESYPKQVKWKYISKEKKDDYRLTVLKRNFSN